MLVKCPQCNVEFSPSLVRCPRCGVWEPEQELTDDYRIVQIQAAFSDGRSARQIRADLVSQGYDVDVAKDLISEGKRRMKPAHRRLGMQLAFKGLLLMGIGAVLYVMLLGLIVFYVVFAVGLALFIVGVIKGWTGWRIE